MIEEKNAEQKENETSPIWKKMLEMLKKLEPKLEEDESKIFCRYFAEMEQGSTGFKFHLSPQNSSPVSCSYK